MEVRLALNITLEDFVVKSESNLVSKPVEEYFKEPKYNLFPSCLIPITTHLNQSDFNLSKWGLIPGWTNTSKNSKGMTSISTQSFQNKPVLQKALSENRCLIWCTGFYIWKESPAGKIPFYVTSSDNSLLSVAGLWENWDESTNTCCLITHDPSSILPFFKTDIPFIIREEKRSAWLNDGSKALELLSIPLQTSVSQLEFFPVNRKIIKSHENDPKFIEKVPYLVAEQTSMFS